MSDEQLFLFDTDLQAHDPLPLPDEWSRLAPDLSTIEDMEQASRAERQEFCGQLLNELVRQYEALRSQGMTVAQHIWKDGLRSLPATMMDSPAASLPEARRAAIEAVMSWTFQPGQDAHETMVYQGAVASSQETVDAIKWLNELKGFFAATNKALQTALTKDSVLHGDMASLLSLVAPAEKKILRAQEVSSIVRSLLHPRLSVRQLIRTVPTLDEVPIAVRWRWVESPSSVKVSRQELLKILEKKADQSFVQLDMQRVMDVAGDQHFALRRKPVRQLRMQIRLVKGSERSRPHLIFKSRLPLFYREAEEGAWRQAPDLSVAPGNAPTQKRKKRLEEKAFLESVPAYRYLREVTANEHNGDEPNGPKV